MSHDHTVVSADYRLARGLASSDAATPDQRWCGMCGALKANKNVSVQYEYVSVSAEMRNAPTPEPAVETPCYKKVVL
jgi:hypothetical protein